jgi:hypothetical protein
METITLNIQMEKADVSLLKNILKNIKGVLNVEETENKLLSHLMHLKETADSTNTISLDEFNKNFDDHLCELYSESKPNSH